MLAKRQISTVYSVVAEIAALHFLWVLIRIGLLMIVLATLEL